ncbi:four helix bundle protein [Candidatus Pollutiaquabacter sp.]|uniref:four helix bundle protein n=1 Tax=Candidatus Pollutiaquabacter sp. TaxID=3416354 RepID=UPI003CC44B1C|nr:four helix bundle protein [Bacteroidota bacterium]
MIQSFKDLQIWNRSVDLSIEIYQATATFPKSELFGLTSQIRRAGVSPAANIAEGWSRKLSRSFHHFLDISRGSLAELYTHWKYPDDWISFLISPPTTNGRE